MKIRRATAADYDGARAFYHALIDDRQQDQYDFGWQKDVYPSPQLLKDSIANGALYLGETDGRIAGAVIVNHECNDGYRDFMWPTALSPDEVTVIHALGIHPAFAGKGYAKQLVRFVIQTARDNGQKAIRLDVLKGNIPAEKLYTGFGFRQLHTLKMFYEDTGWTDYELFELPL